MKSIVMVDYCSRCDQNGKPIGHGIKVGNEYYQYLKDNFVIKQYIYNPLSSFLKNRNIVNLPFSNCFGKGKLAKIIECYKNIKYVLEKEKDEIIWFYLVDIYFFLILLFLHKDKHKIAITLFEDYNGNWLKKKILNLGLHKVDLLFVTSEYLSEKFDSSIFVPDYTYQKEYYEQFKIAHKKEQAVCVGTMNEKKLLEDSVKAFSENGYPLYIVGQFSSIEKYNDLCSIKGENIIIENRFIEEDEYYSLLGESKYNLIPYDPVFYKNRTSGVLQEGLFLDAIPITHKSILNFNKINGIDYERIDDLRNMNLYTVLEKKYYNSYKNIRDNLYNYQNVKDRIIISFNKL